MIRQWVATNSRRKQCPKIARALMISDILNANAVQNALGSKYLTVTNLLGGINASLDLNRKNSEMDGRSQRTLSKSREVTHRAGL